MTESTGGFDIKGLITFVSIVIYRNKGSSENTFELK